MHEFTLYGQVSKNEHNRTIQQLAGVTRMQPKPVRELHLIFKSRVPPGLANVPPAGGSQAATAQEAQRIGKMLSSGLYYVQLVGSIDLQTQKAVNEDTNMTNGHQEVATIPSTKWFLEFKDIPEAGKQTVSSRLIFRTEVVDGDVMLFMQQLGFEYVSRYLVVGVRFYDQETTLFLHQVLQVPQVEAAQQATDTTFLDSSDALQPIDSSGGYILQASIEAVDGNNLELKDRGTKQLIAMKETLKQAVTLTPGDRLALDTRLVVNRRV